MRGALVLPAVMTDFWVHGIPDELAIWLQHLRHFLIFFLLKFLDTNYTNYHLLCVKTCFKHYDP